MKANGAPERLYLLPNGLISYRRNTDEDVEYTQTDAFIEKACEWLEEHMIGWNNDFVKDFRNYMEK